MANFKQLRFALDPCSHALRAGRSIPRLVRIPFQLGPENNGRSLILIFYSIAITIGLASGALAQTHQAELISSTAQLRLPNGKLSHNHSPSIVETSGGNLLACWFHGQGERDDNTMVVLGARLGTGEKEWSEPFVMADHKNLPDQNATLFIDPQRRLWLFRVSSLDNEKRGHFITYLVSTDYERSGAPKWSWQAPLFCRPIDLEQTYVSAVDGMEAAGLIPAARAVAFAATKRLAKEKIWQRLGWMTRQPPIMLNDKRMMLGLYSDVWDCSMMAFTEDAGETWEFSKPIILPTSLLTKSIQPSLVRKKNGNVVAFMRAGPVVRRAESSDGGMTWEEDPLDISCPNLSVAVLGLKSGNWALAVNDGEGRHLLTVYLSDDEGRTWKWKRALERFEPKQGSGHYPTLIQGADSNIHIVYTCTDQNKFEGNTIKHVRFDEAWVKTGDLTTR